MSSAESLALSHVVHVDGPGRARHLRDGDCEGVTRYRVREVRAHDVGAGVDCSRGKDFPPGVKAKGRRRYGLLKDSRLNQVLVAIKEAVDADPF